MISEYLGFDSDYIILGLAAFCVNFIYTYRCEYGKDK